MSLLEADEVFESAAELFALLSTPIRLKLISVLCRDEKNVSQLLEAIETTQPNLSQHLATLYRAGVLGRRREGTQIFYRLINEQAAEICRNVCVQFAMAAAPAEAPPAAPARPRSAGRGPGGSAVRPAAPAGATAPARRSPVAGKTARPAATLAATAARPVAAPAPAAPRSAKAAAPRAARKRA